MEELYKRLQNMIIDDDSTSHDYKILCLLPDYVIAYCCGDIAAILPIRNNISRKKKKKKIK